MSPVCFVTEALSTLRGAALIAWRKGSSRPSAPRASRSPSSASPFSVPPAAPSSRVGDKFSLLRLVTPAFARSGVQYVYTCHARHEKQRPKAKEEVPMKNATTSSAYPISENPKQPWQPRQTAKEVIAANVKSPTEQLEAGHSDALTAYLDAMSRFRRQLLVRKSISWRLLKQRFDHPAWPECIPMEPAWPEGQEGRARHPHPRSHRRCQAQEGRGSREGYHQAEHSRSRRLSQRLRL